MIALLPLIGLVVGLVGFIGWIMALISIFSNSNLSPGKKVLWALIATFVPFGWLLYFLMK